MFVNISSLVIPFRCFRSTCDCESLIFWSGIGGRRREQISSSLPIPRKRGLLCLSFVGMYSLHFLNFTSTMEMMTNLITFQKKNNIETLRLLLLQSALESQPLLQRHAPTSTKPNPRPRTQPWPSPLWWSRPRPSLANKTRSWGWWRQRPLLCPAAPTPISQPRKAKPARGILEKARTATGWIHVLWWIHAVGRNSTGSATMDSEVYTKESVAA